MAAVDVSAWVPIIWDDQVVHTEPQASAVWDSAGRSYNMTSNHIEIPRLVSADVNAGSALTEDSATSEDVSDMFTFQYNGKRTIDEAQSEDSVADVATAYSMEWLTWFNQSYDNACLGVTAARSATALNKQPYNSIYYNVASVNDTVTSYTAGANLLQADLTYAAANTVLGYVEKTRFFDSTNAICFVHPSLKSDLRGLLDSQNRPIFLESSAGFPGGTTTMVRTLLGVPMVFSFGARSTPNYSSVTGTGGNPLIIFASRNHLVRGNRVEPQTRFIPADINLNALEHTVQTRARRGFTLTVPGAAAVLEVNEAD